MNRIKLLVAFLLVFSSTFTSLAAVSAEDVGYVEIYTAEDLDAIRTQLDGKYRLMNDIDLGGVAWEPIGTNSTPFTGELNGNGFEISGMQLTDRTGYVGFFAATEGAVVKDLGLVNSSITINTEAYSSRVGGFAGQAIATTFDRVYSGVDLDLFLQKEYSAYVGGVVGYMSGSTITDSFSYGNVHVKVPTRWHFGTISYPWIAAGTLAGYATGGEITTSYSVGNFSAIGEEIPADTVLTEGSTTITNSYYLGEQTLEELSQQATYDGFDFTNTWKMGSDSGYPFPVLNTAHVPVMNNTTEFAGGMGTSFHPYLLSTAEHVDQIRNYPNAFYELTDDLSLSSMNWTPIGSENHPFTGTLNGNGFKITDLTIQMVSDGTQTTAGLFGFIDSAVVHDLGVVNGQISIDRGSSKSTFYTGGLAARVNNSELSHIFVDNQISSSAYYYSYSGGIAGLFSNSSIVNSYNLGRIYGHSGDNFVYSGGIVASAVNSSFEKVYNGGNVHASSTFYSVHSGGIAGQMSNTSLEDSFNVGNISSSSWSATNTGGLVGAAIENSRVTNTYSIGEVDGRQIDVNIGGGIAGQTINSKVTNSYYFNKNNRLPESESNLSRKTLDEMLLESTYAGFDFSGGTWKMDSDSGFRFPVLVGVEFAIPEMAETLRFQSLPTKLTYLEGESLDLSGAVLTVPTNYLTELEVPVTQDMVGNVNMYTPGVKQVSVSYGNWSIDFEITIIEKDRTPPDMPVVTGEVNERTTLITGTTEPGATVTVEVGNTILGEAVVGEDGKFAIQIPRQTAGTVIFISARDAEGNLSLSNILTVKSLVLTGWVEDMGKKYYHDSNGIPVKGWQYLNGAWYYFAPEDGAMQTGWLWDGVWYYLKSNGTMATGWHAVGSTWYYFAGGGAMKTGWLLDGGTWYYLKGSGAMATGWVQDGSTWYYFKSSGAMQTGWLLSGGVWYYFKGSGAMQTGWLLSGGSWYYFNSGGAMQTGWVQISGKWYLFNSSGVMQ
jgi:hypothetical protein